MANTPLPIISRTYSNREQDPAAQFASWRQYIAPIYEVSPIGRDTSEGFPAEVQSWHLGALLIGRSAFGSHRFFRDQRRIGRDGLTHILVQLCLEGGYAGVADGREMTVAPGEVAIIDLARPLALEAMPTRTLDVIIPRGQLDPDLVGHAKLSGLVLRHDMATANLLVDHFLLVGRRIPDLRRDEASALNRMITATVSACLSAVLPAEAKRRPDAVSLDRVKIYLDGQLSSPKLGPADICRDLGVSRPTLYRMFASHGGVATYIQNQRLAQAYALLVDPSSPHTQVQDVATACGFASAAHFHRSFRQAFGVTPGDVRGRQPKNRVFPQNYASTDFSEVWISQLEHLDRRQ